MKIITFDNQDFSAVTLNFKNQKLGGIFNLSVHSHSFDWTNAHENNLIHIIWNNAKTTSTLEIDGRIVQLQPNSMLTTTFYHNVKHVTNLENLVVFSFNREFYCVVDHDREVSCNGIIFFGAQKQSIITLDEEYKTKLDLLLNVFVDEFEYDDNIQGEMLVMLLKRLIIICTRLTKRNIGIEDLPQENVEIIRQYYVLVDRHYKKTKTVQEYADLLHRSPKTLSNIFSKASNKTPLQIIHERIVLEARRLLTYTDKNVNEIAYSMGFKETASFIKLFKKHEGVSPLKFRESKKAFTADIS